MFTVLNCGRRFRFVSVGLACSLIFSDLAVAIAQEKVPEARRLALFFVPQTKGDEESALLLRGLFRTLADRLAAVGFQRADVSPPEDARALVVVQAKVEDGKRALSTSSWSEALQIFTEAEQALKPALAVADRALVARVYKGLGIALASLNRMEEAKSAMHRSLTVYPNQESSAYGYSVEARNLFAEVLREAQELPNGALEIRTNPPKAEIYVDYEFRGFSPMKVSGLTAGDHLVVAFLDGHVAYASFAKVTAGAEEKLEVTFVPAGNARALKANTEIASRALERGRPFEDAAVGLLQAAGATDALFLQVAGTTQAFTLRGFYAGQTGSKPIQVKLLRDATFVQSAQSLLADAVGVAVPPEPILPPLDTAAAAPTTTAEALLPAEEGEYIIDPHSPIFKDTAKKPEEPGIFKKWWFWTAVGAVVGGAVAVGVVLGRSTGEATTPEGRITILLNRAR